MGAAVMFITTPAFATESQHGKGKNHGFKHETVSNADREYWENFEWESFDIVSYETEVDELEAMEEANAGISLMYLEEVGGTWIQASDGRWWYKHTDGGYTTSNWEKINGKWYYCHETNGNWIDNTGTRMIQEAFKYVGGKYVYGGNSLETGVDCSGYVQQISKKYGITTPRTSKSQYASSTKISYANL